MKDTPAARRWRALVDELHASGLETKAFAARKGVNASTLTWWRSRLRQEPGVPALPTSPAAFTEVFVAPSPERTVVLALGSFDAQLVIGHDTDLALVRRVLEAVA